MGQTRHGLLADDPELADQLKLGMVFQNGALFDSLNVGENVGFQLYEHTKMSAPRIAVSPARLGFGPCTHRLDVYMHTLTDGTMLRYPLSSPRRAPCIASKCI